MRVVVHLLDGRGHPPAAAAEAAAAAAAAAAQQPIISLSATSRAEGDGGGWNWVGVVASGVDGYLGGDEAGVLKSGATVIFSRNVSS